jgi:hypothetical protein
MSNIKQMKMSQLKLAIQQIICKWYTPFIILGIIICEITYCSRTKEEQSDVILLPEHPFFLLEDVNEEILYKTLVHYEFPCPAIITAQAILESGNFKSRLCIEHNNFFGLYNSRAKSYYKFDSWISCVFAYKDFILNKYKSGEDYYKFLDRINYAEDENYIKRLKVLEKQILEKYGK